MKYLIVLNDPPYGAERSFNSLRLATSLNKREDVELRLFLMADSVGCARAAQNTASGYYNLGQMIKGLILGVYSWPTITDKQAPFLLPRSRRSC